MISSAYPLPVHPNDPFVDHIEGPPAGFCDPCGAWHYLSQLRLVRDLDGSLGYRCVEHRAGGEVIPRDEVRIEVEYRPKPEPEPLPRTDYLGWPVTTEKPEPVTPVEAVDRVAGVDTRVARLRGVREGLMRRWNNR